MIEMINGTGKKKTIPSGFNWFAFFFTFLWAFSKGMNNIAIKGLIASLLVLVIPVAGPLLLIFVNITFGFQANKWLVNHLSETGWDFKRSDHTIDNQGANLTEPKEIISEIPESVHVERSSQGEQSESKEPDHVGSSVSVDSVYSEEEVLGNAAEELKPSTETHLAEDTDLNDDNVNTTEQVEESNVELLQVQEDEIKEKKEKVFSKCFSDIISSKGDKYLSDGKNIFTEHDDWRDFTSEGSKACKKSVNALWSYIADPDKEQWNKPGIFDTKHHGSAVDFHGRLVSSLDAIFLYDSTIFGSGDEGIFITENCLYAKNLIEDPICFDLKDIRRIWIDTDDKKITINSEDISYVESEYTKYMKRLVECLNEYINQY